ncbi:MAG: hypothetical protein GY696_34845 [Gammaproteobacteria bacterium]|nr:hypothetical protein [Gammaproteobacteria bacterium]
MSLLGLKDMGMMDLVIDTKTRSIYRAGEPKSPVTSGVVSIVPMVTHHIEAPHAIPDSEHRSRLLSELKDQFPSALTDSSLGKKKGFGNVISLKPETAPIRMAMKTLPFSKQVRGWNLRIEAGIRNTLLFVGGVNRTTT